MNVVNVYLLASMFQLTICDRLFKFSAGLGVTYLNFQEKHQIDNFY